MLRSLVEMLKGEISGQRCLDHVQTISRHHRIQASPGYRAAAQDCLRILADSGLQAQITTYPATGRNREWTHLTPREWVCEDAELWMLDQQGRPQERLAWFQEANLSLIQRSAATPYEGVTAELVAIDDAESRESWGVHAEGKIALVGNGDIHRIWENARAAGALGLITARMTYQPPTRPEGDLPDALQYTSFWWSEEEPEGWGFVVSTRTGERLRRHAARGPVRLWARVDSSSCDGTIENVEAVIPGTDDAGEILVVSHLCHPKPSANDNATGPATAMETARALNRLIKSGHLPQPRRSIRFLHPPEMTGTYAHLAGMSTGERDRIAAAINLDMVGQRQELTGSVLLCEYPPLACPSFAGDLLALALRETAAELNAHSGAGSRFASFRHAVVGYSGGSDHYILADPTVGVPCPMLIQWPDRFYHTSADTPDRCDPEMMRRVGVMTGAYAYFLAAAGVREVAWLAGEMVSLFPAQLHAAMEGCADPEAMAGFRVDRKLADLESLRRLLSPVQQAQIERRLEVCSTQVKLLAEMELQRASLSPAEPVATSEDGLTVGWLDTADLRRLYPRRSLPGPISLRNCLHRLSREEIASWRGFEAEHRGAARLCDQLCYWADGQRSLAEVVRLTALETGIRDDAWALGYFQLLGRLDLAEGV